MRQLILEKVADAAEILGLPRERVMGKSEKDNLTLPRPRVELDFLPETLTRTGRRLGARLTDAAGVKLIRKELYEVSLPVAAQILASDADWLEEFRYRLAAVLPRGFNDREGNYVQLEARQGEWDGLAVKRVGGQVINPLPRYGYLLHINAAWRVTADRAQQYITEINLNPRHSRESGNPSFP